jgi:hypothetical protein
MSQQAARSTKADSPYESRAETEAAVERIHERFKQIRAAIAKEKVEKTSVAVDSHRRQRQSASGREALQLSLGALTEARDFLDAAQGGLHIHRHSEASDGAERLRDG